MTMSTIRLFAQYNSRINSEMNTVLSTLTPQQWESRKGDNPSIASLCSHLCASDRAWLVCFRDVRDFNSLLDPIFAQPPLWDAQPFSSFDEYCGLRRTLDKTISSFADEVSRDDMQKSVSYRDRSGARQNRNVGGLIIHMFNHQTHHRGMINMCLTQMGKEIDLSDMVKLV